MLDPELIQLAEAAEAEFMFQYESSAPQPAYSTLGIATARLGGGVVLSMRHDPSGYWNKALGFGFDEPVTEELIAQVIDFYRTQRSPQAVLQIAPSVLPANWAAIRDRHGLDGRDEIVKLASPMDDVKPRTPAQSPLRTEPVTAEVAYEWAGVVLRAFGLPEPGLTEMLAQSATHPQFRPFAVWHGDRIVGGANLFVHGRVGSLNSGAVLPEYRRMGGQSQLVAARVAAAAELGCDWIVVETGKPADDSVNQSLSNMRQAGLQPRYVRRNWVWQPGAAGI